MAFSFLFAHYPILSFLIRTYEASLGELHPPCLKVNFFYEQNKQPKLSTFLMQLMLKWTQSLSFKLEFSANNTFLWKALLNALAKSQITSLDLSTVRFGIIHRKENEAPAILKDTLGMMARNLKELNLAGNYLGESKTFFREVNWNWLLNIEKLDLSQNRLAKLPNSQWSALTNHLALSRIQDLNLADNDLNELDDQVWQQLIMACRQMRYLKTLNLSLRNDLKNLSYKRRTLLKDLLMQKPTVTLIISQEDDPDNFWQELRNKERLNIEIQPARTPIDYADLATFL